MVKEFCLAISSNHPNSNTFNHWVSALMMENYRKNSARLTKSKKRIAAHGEVFTPAWVVEAMLDLLEEESFRIESRILEPACGSGNFLVGALVRKLKTVNARYAGSPFELRHNGLLALMNIYGIELLEDNLQECKENLLEVFLTELEPFLSELDVSAAETVLNLNIVQGDALTYLTKEKEPIVLPEWSYLKKGKFQRRDFEYRNLAGRSELKGTLFEEMNEAEVFRALRVFQKISIEDIARGRF